MFNVHCSMCIVYLTSSESRFHIMSAQVLTLIILGLLNPVLGTWPVVITTWEFNNATAKAWEVLNNGGTAFDAIEQGCMVCELTTLESCPQGHSAAQPSG